LNDEIEQLLTAADGNFLVLQGLPGQTLPGTAGEQGRPGEKVSVTKPKA